MRYRRNATDEELRRLARERAQQEAQAALDRHVVAKVRAGRAGEITLAELSQAAPRTIPLAVLHQAFQGLVDRMAREGTSPQFNFRGADIEVFRSAVRLGGPNRPHLVVSVDTPDLEPEFVYPGPNQIPAVRFYLNEAVAESDPDPSEGWYTE